MITQEKILVVGAGLYGAIVAREFAEKYNKQVQIIDRRNHIAGNCYDKDHEETKIKYHVYGSHIFHTSDEEVWEYINKFSKFDTFYHTVLTQYKGKTHQLPFNLDTVNNFYNVNLKPNELDQFFEKERAKEYYETPQNMEEQAINLIGRPLYEAFIKGYTIKQWAKNPKELPAEIIKRLPIRNNYNRSYFKDKYVAIPTDGYTTIFNNLLNHKNISISLNTDFSDVKNTINDDTYIIYTGAIDEYFNFDLGHLEYRTIEFEHEVIDSQDYQGIAVMNYAEENVPYTRICEHRHFYPRNWDQYHSDKTLISKEYSKEDNGLNPYYPINNERNKSLFSKYKERANNIKNIHFGGRLGGYEYLDMHIVIKKALVFVNHSYP